MDFPTHVSPRSLKCVRVFPVSVRVYVCLDLLHSPTQRLEWICDRQRQPTPNGSSQQQEERNGGRRRKSSLTCLKYDPSALSSQLKRWGMDGRNAKRFRGLCGNHGLLTEPRRR